MSEYNPDNDSRVSELTLADPVQDSDTLYIITSNGSRKTTVGVLRQHIQIHVGSTAPANPGLNQLWLEI